MKRSGWHVGAACMAVGVVAVLVWRSKHRSVKATITLPPSTDERITARFVLSLLEPARTFSPAARRRLVLQLIQVGYLRDITSDYAEPERFDELLVIMETRAFPNGPPED